ncbi:Uncharacterized protein dnl_15000 [Desulfonema limicola]|uniref:Uncharacterized protein n=1 Tax=Desulfonema limicola TaxID=45656 RepID=A0A975GFJ6_9BACT|nr:hypothetical protein [Desulfonema limicola]QTA79244.1 Uncharacterized protein dnl_15000 [Desulfonema limicola]
MSIRLVAIDLYRLIKEVETLEKKIEKAPFDKKEALKDQLRRLKTERDRMRRMLEGKKDSL